MIRYIRHHFINRAKYDHCIRLDKNDLIYGYSWYLDTVTESWDALVLNDYDAVWPLPVRRKYGFKYFYRPYGIQQLGIFSKVELEAPVKQQFFEQMQEHCSFADIYMNEEQLTAFSAFKRIKSHLNKNYILHLNASYRQLYSSFKSNTKRTIKKANDNKLSIFEHDSPDVIVDIFKENRGGDLKLKEEFYRNMKKIMYLGLHNGTGKLWTVYGDGNSILGGAYFLVTKTRHTLLFTGLTSPGRDLKAMFFLINEYIILHSEKPLILDFEGSNLESLAHFYRSFGSREVHYQGIRYNGLPLPLKWLKE